MACKGCGDKSIADAYFCNKCLITKKKFLWCVITEVSKNELDNRYDDLIQAEREQIKEYAQRHMQTIKETIEVFGLKKYRKINSYYSSMKSEAFTLGEIFPIDPYFERELTGGQRKPGKWDIGYETFPAASYHKALERAIQVRGD